ncbi:MAG: trypsin-like serine protease [Planctomycetaceae bacterium]
MRTLSGKLLSVLALGLVLAGTNSVLGAESISPEGNQTASEARAADRAARLTDAAWSILNEGEPVEIDGLDHSPVPSFAQRLELAAKKLANDTKVAAGEAVDEFVDSLTGPFSSLYSHIEVIVGNPTWKRVSNTKAKTYRSVCYLEMTFPYGNRIATASLVGKRVLVSNAHCVYSSELGEWATSIRVVPGKNSTGSSSEPYGSLTTSLYYTPYAWTYGSESNRDYEISWIILPSATLYNKVGYYFGYKTTTDSELRTMNLNMSGYPGKKNIEQWREYVKTDQVVYTNQFKHYFDTVGGSSGSPMYQLKSGSRYIVGVNCAEVTSAPVYNIATRMTSSYFNITKDFKAQYP